MLVLQPDDPCYWQRKVQRVLNHAMTPIAVPGQGSVAATAVPSEQVQMMAAARQALREGKLTAQEYEHIACVSRAAGARSEELRAAQRFPIPDAPCALAALVLRLGGRVLQASDRTQVNRTRWGASQPGVVSSVREESTTISLDEHGDEVVHGGALRAQPGLRL